MEWMSQKGRFSSKICESCTDKSRCLPQLSLTTALSLHVQTHAMDPTISETRGYRRNCRFGGGPGRDKRWAGAHGRALERWGGGGGHDIHVDGAASQLLHHLVLGSFPFSPGLLFPHYKAHYQEHRCHPEYTVCVPTFGLLRPILPAYMLLVNV